LPYTSFGELIGNSIAWKLILLVFIQVFWVTMVYGPIAAYLVEAFPARIRYTALSLPYHIGNGFGGLLPLIGLAIIAQTGSIYAGLYYPMIVAGITFIVGSLLLRETKNVRIWDETHGQRALGADIEGACLIARSQTGSDDEGDCARPTQFTKMRLFPSSFFLCAIR
jgi:hypothetical protein